MTETLPLFFQACVIGGMVAIPIGPVGLLVIQRSLQVGWLAGVASGIGAAIADGIFGLCAALGLVALIGGVEEAKHFIRPIGSFLLVLIGLYFVFQKPPAVETEEVLSARYTHHYFWDTVSTLILTLMNPITIIAFAAVFVGSGLMPEDPRRIDYLEVSTGVFTGSFLWWIFLVVAAQPLKKRLSPTILHRGFQITGLVLTVVGAVSFIPRLPSAIDKLEVLIHRIAS